MKYQEIVDGEWDCLIILDACRYDDFEEIYSRYLNGKLEKRLSKGSNTPMWLENTFPHGKYDITYISANPYINSKGISLSSLRRNSGSWKATDKFKSVVDVWDYGYDDNIKVVHPATLTEEAIKHMNESDGKFIVHFLQPHEPFFISTDNEDYLNHGIGRLRKRIKTGEKKIQKKSSLRKLLGKLKPLYFRLPSSIRYRITTQLLREPVGIHKKYWYEGRLDDLRRLYKSNLEIVLANVSYLLTQIPKGKKVVITADHGEAFGENDVFKHPDRKIPILLEVPWLELYGEGDIRKGKDNKKLSRNRKSREDEEKSQEKVKERLRDLGYMD